MDRAALRRSLVRHEGEVLHAYDDSEGYMTIGVGRLIDQRRGGGISHDEAMHLLDNDIADIEAKLDSQLSWWRTLGGNQQQALAQMAFQLGVRGLLGFPRMLSALKRGDSEGAYLEALNSKWAQQTPERAHEVASLLR